MTVDFVVMNASVFFSEENSSHFFGIPCGHKVNVRADFCVGYCKFTVFDSVCWNNFLRILCLAHIRMY